MRAIYCAGEQGRVVLDILERGDSADDIVFFDDDESLWGTSIDGHEVLGGLSKLRDYEPEAITVIVAYGDRQSVRIDIADRISDMGHSLFSAIDDAATVAPTATVGDGVIVNAQSYIGPDATLSDLVLIDSTVNVSHDVSLAEGVTVGPNATIAGGVHVGRDAFIGAGATILDDLTVGGGAFVGAGAVVTSDVAPDTTVVGIPAEPVD